MSIITRLFSRNRGTDIFTGAIRIGGTEYNSAWSHARLLNSVYKNPTGYRVIENTASEFMRPDWAMFDADNKRVPNDPFQAVLDKPMPMITGTVMQYNISRDLDVNGGTFLVKMRGRDYYGDNGPITGLKRLPPQRVTVMTGDDDELLGFIYVDRAGNRAAILPEESAYVHFPDGERDWHRLPPAAVAGLPADIDNAAMRFNAELLDNDGGLPGYLVVDGLSPKVFKEWVAEWRQNESPGKTRVLSSGGGGPGASRGNASYVRVGVSNTEMMYDRLREMAKEDICLAHGYPTVLLNPDGTTFANMDTAKRNWICGRVLPRWVWVRDALNVQLGDDLPVANRKIGFNLETVEELTENLDDTIAREAQVLAAGAQTINQFLEKIGREKVPWGDEQPRALADANTSPEPPQMPPEPSPTKSRIIIETKAKAANKTYLAGFHDRVDAKEAAAASAMRAMFLVQGEAISARIRSKQGKSYRKATEDWWDGERWNTAVAQVVHTTQTSMVKSVGDFAMSTFQPDNEFDATSTRISDYLANRSVDVAGLINGTTSDDLRSIIDEIASEGGSIEEMSSAVRGYFTDNAEMRAARFARTEMIGAANFAANEAAKQTGLTLEKSIDSASTADEECSSLADEWVGLDDSFSDGGDGPPIHPNCRCALVFREVES